MPNKPQKSKYGITVIGHRGYSSKYPENTLLAFEQSIKVGADYIEFDVRKTSDNILVVFHNNTTKGLVEKPKRIEQYSYKELAAIELPENQHIPKLEEVLKLCKDKIGLQIELKGVGVAEATVKMVNEMGVRDQVLYSAFNDVEIFKIKEIDPDVYYAPLISSGDFIGVSPKEAFYWAVYKAEKLGAKAVHPPMSMMDEGFMEIAKERNINVNVWTVDGIPLWDALIEMEVDGIITNDPKGLIDFLKTR